MRGAAFLVCASANAQWIVEGSEFHECSQCAAPIMVAPSGLILLADHPDFVKLCFSCGGARLLRECGPVKFMGAASDEVLAEEMRSAVRNTEGGGR